MNNDQVKIEDLMSTGIDYIQISISKESVLNMDFSEPILIAKQYLHNIKHKKALKIKGL